MRIVNFKGGLGNQIFQYIMCLYLKEKYPKEKIYGYYNPKFLKDHNGLEIQNVFSLELPPQTAFSNLITFLIRGLNRMVKGLKAEDDMYYDTAIYYDGWWQNKKYFQNNINKLNFRDFKLDNLNKELFVKIKTSNSVALHVRRGDYMTPKNIERYGGICTLLYYQKAMQIVESNMKDPHYFIFSNDMDWAKKNLKVTNVTYVTNNANTNSYLDMFLMSHCKAHIIANSSFSFWGAMLNKNPSRLVVYPSQWFHSYTPDLFPKEWIGILG